MLWLMKRSVACAVSAAIALTGCSVAYQDPVTESTSTPSPADTIGVGKLPPGRTLDRAEVASVTQATIDCSSGAVTIVDSGAVAIKGNCPSVTVNGVWVVLVADHIGKLEVDGVGNVVLTRTVDEIVLVEESSGSVVQWEAGQPKIENHSPDSVLIKAP